MASGDREGEAAYRRALAIFETASGARHPDVANVLKNLAAVKQVQGEYSGAEALARRALETVEPILDGAAGSPPVELDDETRVVIETIRRASLGVLQALRAQGRYREGEPLLRRVLELAERALGPDEPEVGACLNSEKSTLSGRGGAS